MTDVDEPEERFGHEMMPERFEARATPSLLPSGAILGLIGDKWTTVVLYCLALDEPRRFNELQRRIPGISKKMLVQTLRALEGDGLVDRKVYEEVPPRTEYRLTQDGRRIRQPIEQLCRWAIANDDLVSALIARRALR